MVIAGVVLFCSLAQAAPPRVPASPPRDQAATPGKDADADALAAGWRAVDAGQYEAAAKAAEAVLQRRPWDQRAHVLRIQALAKLSPDRGSDAYEQWLTRRHAEDAAMFEPVPIAVLQQIASGPKPELREPALRALLIARVPGAREALAAAGTEQAQLDIDLEAARRGDAGTIQRLNQQASGAGASAALARALGELGAAGEPGLLQLAQSPDVRVRAAAVDGLGGVKTAASRAAVAALGQDSDPAIRQAVPIALARMGDPDALATMDRMLASGIPDLQIMASRAFEGRPGPWVAAVRSLLDNPEGLTRIEAAQAIAPVDPDAARRVLEAALTDGNPAVRYESARIAQETPALSFDGSDLASLRRRLKDPDPAVRLAVAGALLRLAR